MIEEKNILEKLSIALKNIRVIFDQNSFDNKLKQLEKEIAKDGFWENNQKAQNALKEKNFVEKIINEFQKLKNSHNDLNDFIYTLEEEYDDELCLELKTNLKSLRKNIKSLEANCYLSNEMDKLDCYLEVHAGAGGTESQDWADMIRRMYLKWSEKSGRSCILISESKGDEAGIKSSTIRISGLNSFGYLKNESGVHRLVRISPFDSNKEDTLVLLVFGFILWSMIK